ncbi:MAG TPA: rhomboid family intramembrane serine protease [Anaeromyxobacter sp.]|nr:rhomboid family intramembrane serine protease [Anaeromyxobacter sp.]
MIPLKDDNPVLRTPLVTYLLVLANVAAFLWQIGLPRVLGADDVLGAMAASLNRSVLRGGAIPIEILRLRDIYPPDIVPPPLTVLTSMFLHGGPLHLAFNMLFLWIFGNNVEDALGRLRFLVFYLLCGCAAAAAQIAFAHSPAALRAPMVGASGAIAGVLAAYLVLFPRARVLTLVVVFIFIRLVPLPAGWFIGIWFAGQLLSVLFGASSDVAFFAHIGGFVAGFLLVRVFGRHPAWRARRVTW